MDYKLVLGGVEGMLVRVALEDSGCCAGMEDKAGQNSLSESSEMHGNGEFPVVEQGCFWILRHKSKRLLWNPEDFPIHFEMIRRVL